MGARGKRSREESNLVVLEGGKGSTRLPPPDDLTSRQKDIWRRIVATEPPEFFATAVQQDMLKDLCRHRSAVEVVDEKIAEFNEEWIKTDSGLKRWDRMGKSRDRESLAADRKARALRLTNQSKWSPQTAATASRNEPKTKYPWET